MGLIQIVEQKINNWDPVHLFPFCPEDEYSSEIREIAKYIQNETNISSEKLAQEIRRIFIYYFGAETVIEDNQEEVANEILNDINKENNKKE